MPAHLVDEGTVTWNIAFEMLYLMDLNKMNMSLKEKVKRQIDEMDDQIKVWEAKMDSAKAEAKAEYKEKLAALKAKRNDVKAKFEELSDAAEDKWEESKEVFASASDSFKEGFNKLKSLFG